MQLLCAPTHRFFEDYKKNEHKEVIVDEFLGAEQAKNVIRDSLVRTALFLLHHKHVCSPSHIVPSMHAVGREMAS